MLIHHATTRTCSALPVFVAPPTSQQQQQQQQQQNTVRQLTRVLPSPPSCDASRITVSSDGELNTSGDSNTIRTIHNTTSSSTRTPPPLPTLLPRRNVEDSAATRTSKIDNFVPVVGKGARCGACERKTTVQHNGRSICCNAPLRRCAYCGIEHATIDDWRRGPDGCFLCNTCATRWRKHKAVVPRYKRKSSRIIYPCCDKCGLVSPHLNTNELTTCCKASARTCRFCRSKWSNKWLGSGANAICEPCMSNPIVVRAKLPKEHPRICSTCQNAVRKNSDIAKSLCCGAAFVRCAYCLSEKSQRWNRGPGDCHLCYTCDRRWRRKGTMQLSGETKNSMEMCCNVCERGPPVLDSNQRTACCSSTIRFCVYCRTRWSKVWSIWSKERDHDGVICEACTVKPLFVRTVKDANGVPPQDAQNVSESPLKSGLKLNPPKPANDVATSSDSSVGASDSIIKNDSTPVSVRDGVIVDDTTMKSTLGKLADDSTLKDVEVKPSVLTNANDVVETAKTSVYSRSDLECPPPVPECKPLPVSAIKALLTKDVEMKKTETGGTMDFKGGKGNLKMSSSNTIQHRAALRRAREREEFDTMNSIKTAAKEQSRPTKRPKPLLKSLCNGTTTFEAEGDLLMTSTREIRIGKGARCGVCSRKVMELGDDGRTKCCMAPLRRCGYCEIEHPNVDDWRRGPGGCVLCNTCATRLRSSGSVVRRSGRNHVESCCDKCGTKVTQLDGNERTHCCRERVRTCRLCRTRWTRAWSGTGDAATCEACATKPFTVFFKSKKEPMPQCSKCGKDVGKDMLLSNKRTKCCDVAVQRCAYCKAEKTMCWRRGPDHCILCNACGLRARSSGVVEPQNGRDIQIDVCCDKCSQRTPRVDTRGRTMCCSAGFRKCRLCRSRWSKTWIRTQNGDVVCDSCVVCPLYFPPPSVTVPVVTMVI